jgi:hypothetical protein
MLSPVPELRMGRSVPDSVQNGALCSGLCFSFLNRIWALCACSKGWPVGSAAPPGAHFCVWLPLPLPRPGLRGPNPPSPPGSRGTPFFHRSARARLSAALGGRFSGALRRRRVALTASRGRRETSSRPSSSRKPWPIKASAGTSSLLLPSLP